MCEWCEQTESGVMYCQDCGIIICFDTKFRGDIEDTAYVTASGDLFCARCGRRYDEAEEEEAAGEWMPPYYYDDTRDEYDWSDEAEMEE